jgi:hypothetical protein
MTKLRIPAEWLKAAEAHDMELDVVGRREAPALDTPRGAFVLLLRCLVTNAGNLRLTDGAVKALESRLARLLEDAAKRAHEQQRTEVTEADVA